MTTDLCSTACLSASSLPPLWLLLWGRNASPDDLLESLISDPELSHLPRTPLTPDKSLIKLTYYKCIKQEGRNRDKVEDVLFFQAFPSGDPLDPYVYYHLASKYSKVEESCSPVDCPEHSHWNCTEDVSDVVEKSSSALLHWISVWKLNIELWPFTYNIYVT